MIVGIALALSSTAIVVPILAHAEAAELAERAGRASRSSCSRISRSRPSCSRWRRSARRRRAASFSALLVALGQAALALVVIVVGGRLALRPLFSLVAQTRSPELFMAASFLIVIAAALAAGASGLSMALGAFIAGLLLAETEYRRAIEAVVDPFKGLLLGVFFVSVGMGLDVTALAQAPVAILAVCAAASSRQGRHHPRPRRACSGCRRAVGLETGLLLGPGRRVRLRHGRRGLAATGSSGRTSAQAILVVTTVDDGR